MTDSEWKLLTWKQQELLTTALKKGKEKLSMRFFTDNYADPDQGKKAFKNLVKNGYLEKTNIGNKYRIVEDKIPEEELKEEA